MMLMSTLNAEVDRINRQRARLARARFAALSRCDHITAKRLADESAALKTQLVELTDGQPQFSLNDE